MRTTLTIDDDVAAALKRLRKSRDASFKELVNDALRRGLRDMNEVQKPSKPFRTRSVSLGQLKIENLDNISEVLAQIEGEDYK
jgi:Ribbon-helix-helix protein, copG family